MKEKKKKQEKLSEHLFVVGMNRLKNISEKISVYFEITSEVICHEYTCNNVMLKSVKH